MVSAAGGSRAAPDAARPAAPAASVASGLNKLNGWPYVRFKARIDFVRFLMGIGYERAIEYPWIFHALDLNERHRFIDIGSGNTIFPLYVKQATGAMVHCVDLDTSILTLSGYAKKAGLGDALQNGTLVIRHLPDSRLPYPDNFFDRLACISTIEHCPGDTDTQTMRELVRVVRPGGTLAFSVPISAAHQDVFVQGQVYNRKYAGEPVFYERQYDARSLEDRLIAPSGAELIALQAFGEPGFAFGSRVAYNRYVGIGRLLKPLRWTMPAFAHRFIKPIPLENCPPRSFCCFALRKSVPTQ